MSNLPSACSTLEDIKQTNLTPSIHMFYPSRHTTSKSHTFHPHVLPLKAYNKQISHLPSACSTLQGIQQTNLTPSIYMFYPSRHTTNKSHTFHLHVLPLKAYNKPISHLPSTCFTLEDIQQTNLTPSICMFYP